MFKYKVKYFKSADAMEFESKYHIAMLKSKLVGKLNLIKFEDANVTINLPYVEELEIDDKKYLLKAYEV